MRHHVVKAIHLLPYPADERLRGHVHLNELSHQGSYPEQHNIADRYSNFLPVFYVIRQFFTFCTDSCFQMFHQFIFEAANLSLRSCLAKFAFRNFVHFLLCKCIYLFFESRSVAGFVYSLLPVIPFRAQFFLCFYLDTDSIMSNLNTLIRSSSLHSFASPSTIIRFFSVAATMKSISDCSISDGLD